jgi:hypothetical protein
MATWHQQQRPVKLWDERQWTVVIDPPGEPRWLMLFGTEREAAQFAKRGGQHVYVLPPANQHHGA